VSHPPETSPCTLASLGVSSSARSSSPWKLTSRRAQPPGATLHFRVMVLDPKLPDGHGDWTAWAPVIVS
jgi:hypothetical protein